MSMKQIDGYRIRMNQMLGRGSFGSVYVGQCDKTHKKVAVKIMSKKEIDSDDYLKGALFQQIKIMQSLKNPNIVQFIQVMESSKNYYIIQQLCDGDISKLMPPGKENSQNISIDMLTQICNGFLQLVGEGIIHRDLKPANIMIKDKILKIGDFGFAKKIPNPKQKVQSIVGTPLYMPLQILKSQDYTSKCDIWAIGVIFYQLLHGYPPWTAKREYQLIQNIESKSLQIKRKDLSPVTVDFIKKCLGIKQSQRISWDQLFVHPIFKGFFHQQGGQNQVFQNKLKQILNDLRFYIKSNNLDLCKILYNLGYTNENQQLDFQRYYVFLQTVNPTISQQQALYIFKQTDTDKSNRISIKQIQNLLNKHSISFNSTFQKIPIFKKQQSESFSFQNQEIVRKINNCFTRLYKIIQKNKITLLKVFNDFDKQKDGKLSQKQFVFMIKKLDSSIPDEEIIQAFNFIDQDGSKTIQFEQLNKYYSKVNGIPNTFSSRSIESMDIQYPSMSNSYDKNPKNPFFKLHSQNSLPENYQNPMMHMGGYYPPNQMGFMPPPPPTQNQGFFGNFIMNQLSQNIQGQYPQQNPMYYGFNNQPPSSHRF